jgi:uncharacterized membrane protein
VLDHTRDYLGGSHPYPRDVTDTSLFLTRWVTHYCAPIFVFLAGVSAYLYGARGRTAAELSRFLATRGVWLIVLELTVIKVAGSFSFRPDFFTLQVIWAIGAAMIVLAALVHLPRWAIGAFGAALIGGHNLLDGITPSSWGGAAWVWHLLHVPTKLQPAAGTTVFALYPLIPWVGVLAAGYAFGPVMLREAAARRRIAVTLGAGAILLFVALRGGHGYGDPADRVAHESGLASLLSWLNCEKYPPSLHYLLMTLGPGLLALGLVGEVRGTVGRVLVIFGRVPMFYYVAHLYVLHALAVAYVLATHGSAGWLFGGKPTLAKPEGYGVSLLWVYVAWLAVVAALYPACRWFAGLKQRRKEWWLSYL